VKQIELPKIYIFITILILYNKSLILPACITTTIIEGIACCGKWAPLKLNSGRQYIKSSESLINKFSENY
jgi:hypothetical protein